MLHVYAEAAASQAGEPQGPWPPGSLPGAPHPHSHRMTCHASSTPPPPPLTPRPSSSDHEVTLQTLLLARGRSTWVSKERIPTESSDSWASEIQAEPVRWPWSPCSLGGPLLPFPGPGWLPLQGRRVPCRGGVTAWRRDTCLLVPGQRCLCPPYPPLCLGGAQAALSKSCSEELSA